MSRLLPPLFVSTAIVMLAGCQPPPAPLAAARPTLKLDAVQVAAIANKSSANWHDATLAPIATARPAGYRTLAASVPWKLKLPSTSSSTPALRYAGTPTLYVASEAAAGSAQIFRVSATSGALLDAGWDVLKGLSAPGVFKNTGVLLSADAKRLYLATSGGYFLVVDAATGTRVMAQKISNAGFADTAPFIDYSNGGGIPLGSSENVYLVSNDGSLHRVHVTPSSYAFDSWVADNGVDRDLGTGNGLIPYGEAVTVSVPPIVWNGQAFFGSTAGRCYRLDVSAGPASLTVWRPDHMTSARSAAILAPVSIDFDASLHVTDVFVPCGDRLAWIDPDKAVSGDAVTVSPPLLVSLATQRQGRLADYPYDQQVVHGPYDCLDFASIAAKASPAPSRWGNGTATDSRLFGADGYATPTDGNRIHGYMQFEIPPGDFGGGVPVAGRIDLSAANAPASEETVRLFRASNFAGGTDAFWTGMNYTPDIDWANRPDLFGAAIGGFSGSVSASDPATGLPRYGLAFTDALPGDRPNIDETYVWHAFGMTSQGKQRNDSSKVVKTAAARWYRGDVADAATEPKLFVTVDHAATTPAAHGLRGQATIDPTAHKAWVMGSNALFELDTTSRDAFQSKAHTTFTMTEAGRTAGPSASDQTYVLPTGNVLHTGSRLLVADADPATDRFFVNRFASALSPTSDALASAHDAGAGAGRVGGQMLYDYLYGNAMMTTTDGHVICVKGQ